MLTPEEGAALFDELARRTLGISGRDFIAGVKAGTYDWDQTTEIDNLMSMMPLALHLADV